MIGTDHEFDEISIDLLADEDELDHINCRPLKTFQGSTERILQHSGCNENDRILSRNVPTNVKSITCDEKDKLSICESLPSPQSSSTLVDEEYHRATNTINQLSQSQQESCLMLSQYFNHQSVFSQLSQLEYEIPDTLLSEINKSNTKTNKTKDKSNSSEIGRLLPDNSSDLKFDPVTNSPNQGQNKTMPGHVKKSKIQYDFKQVVIQENGSLGMSIGSSLPPKDLIDEIIGILEKNSSCHTTDNALFDDVWYQGKQFKRESGTISDDYPVVEKAMLVLGAIKNDSIASLDAPSCTGFRYGIRADDWLFLLQSNPKQKIVLHLDYEATLDAAKHSNRPLAFCVARRRITSNVKSVPDAKDNNELLDLDNTHGLLNTIHLTTCSAASAMPKKESQNEFASLNNSKKNRIRTSRTPFCVACQQSGRIRPQQHHPWCENNPHFKTSGAKHIMDRIHSGVAVHCVACLYESKNGKKCKHHKHTQKCPQHQKYQSQRVRSDHRRTSKSRKSNNTAIELKPPRNRTKPNECEKKTCDRDQDYCVSSESDEDTSGDENESIYQNESSRHVQLIVAKRRGETNHYDKSAAPTIKNKKKEHELKGPQMQHVEATLCHQNHDDISKQYSAQSSIVQLQSRADWSRKSFDGQTNFPVKDYSDDDDDDAGCFRDQLEIDWDSCENPWGSIGHLDGDVSLHCSNYHSLQRKEMITPMQEKRFTLFPFEYIDGQLESRYAKTHISPDDGVQCILLKRNAIATRQWGFSIQRHGFGGACLVSSVDDLSPAAAAVCYLLFLT
jgi:hypothetical protein